MKGKVTVPSRVKDHFLAYINPQEAEMLRKMGGGMTKKGQQKMMNGVPFFGPGDGDPTAEGQEFGPSSNQGSTSDPGPAPGEPESTSQPVEGLLEFGPQPMAPQTPETPGLAGGIMNLAKSIADKGILGTLAAAVNAPAPVQLGARGLGIIGGLVTPGPGMIAAGASIPSFFEDAFGIKADIDDPMAAEQQLLEDSGDFGSQ